VVTPRTYKARTLDEVTLPGRSRTIVVEPLRRAVPGRALAPRRREADPGPAPRRRRPAQPREPSRR